MITIVPQTLDGFKSCVKNYARCKNIPHTKGLEAAAQSMGFATYECVRKVYESSYDAPAFLYDITSEGPPVMIKIPKSIDISSDEIEVELEHEERKTQDVCISVMKVTDAVGWMKVAGNIEISENVEFRPGHFFDSCDLVAIIHHPDDSSKMVGFLSFDISLSILGIPYGATDFTASDLDDDRAVMRLDLSMIQVDKAFQRKGYGTAAVLAAMEIIRENMIHIASAIQAYGASIVEMNVEAECMNNASLKLGHLALTHLSLIEEDQDWIEEEYPEKWSDIHVQIKVGDESEFS